MKLSSLDIRKQQFSRIVRGYDRDEVDAFLDMVGTQWQELVDDMRRMEEKVTEMQLKLDHYQKVEEALEEAVKGARSSAEKKLENAEKSATAILEKAETRAVDITMNAENDRLVIKRETAKYAIRQKEMLSKFRAFLTSELEMLSYHENQNQLEDSDGSSARLVEASILNNDLEAVIETEAAPDGADQTENQSGKTESDSESKSSDLPGKRDGSGDKKEKVIEEEKAVAKKAESKAKEDSSSDEAAASDEASSDSEDVESISDDSLEPEMSSDAVNGDSSDSTTDSKHRKPSWTVNTLVSPGESEKPENDSDSDRKAAKPSGGMRAAQEEIDNLRKLLKNLE